MAVLTNAQYQELDSRSANGGSLHVSLWWLVGSSRCQVRVRNDTDSQGFTFSVPADQAREAFQHPYAYMR